MFSRDIVEDSCHIRDVRHIARTSNGGATRALDFPANSFGVLLVYIERKDACSACRKPECDCAPNPASCPGDHRAFSVEAKFIGGVDLELSEGHSSFPRNEVFLILLLGFGPNLAARHRDRQIQDLLPHFSILQSPEIIAPVSMSMMSGIRSASGVLVESFSTGAIGLPVGVPSPVVKSTRFAPAPTCAVTHSTSLPGVH